MPSYKNLVMIALAASSVSPVLSAPTRSKLATEAPGSRAIAELEGRTPPKKVKPDVEYVDRPEGSGKVVAPLALLAGLTGGMGVAYYDHQKHMEMNQRDVSPQTVALLNALAERADDSDPPEDSDTILHLLSRALRELD